MNILIIDDIEENIYSLKMLIEEESDVNVFSALNASDAIEILMTNSIDLILCDVQMPEITGFEFAQYIKNIEGLKNIPLIFITAIYNKEEYRAKGYELGAIDYITKPIDTKILQSKLLKYLEIYKIRKELYNQNKHIRKLLNTTGVGYVLTNPNIENSPVVFVNDYFCQFTGYSRDEIIGKDLSILKVDNSDRKEREKIKEALEKKVPVSVILKNKNKNGEIYYNKVSISPIFYENSTDIQFFVGVQSNVTSVVKEKKFFETVLNTSQSIILVTNGDELKRINKKFFDLFDFENINDFKAKHKCICELFEERENKNYIQSKMNEIPWNKYILSTPDLLHEVCMLDKNGEERIFKVESSGQIFEDGNDEEVITFTDITQLTNQRKMIEEQSKFVAMGEMIGMIAHQWRQPLTTLSLVLDKMNILNQMDQLNTKVFDEQYTKSINLIQYMSKTINDFKNFFQDNNTNEKILLEELLYQSYELIAPALNEKSVNLEIVIEENCQKQILKINSSKISQVFLNLYKNSLDEFKSKQIEEPYIQTKCYKNSNYIIIEISDNAGGIPQNIINKIFDPYFSTKSKNGTGIGLYMSKIIIEQHLSGLIEVTNENNGACFKIMLPLNLIS
jgi:PAS domain S-box-containing protein